MRKFPEYTNSQVEHAIKEYIHSEKHRRILIRYLVDGLTYDELAEEFDYSVRQISRIVYKCEQIIFKYI